MILLANAMSIQMNIMKQNKSCRPCLVYYTFRHPPDQLKPHSTSGKQSEC
jgi:hypothetical protein